MGFIAEKRKYKIQIIAEYNHNIYCSDNNADVTVEMQVCRLNIHVYYLKLNITF